MIQYNSCLPGICVVLGIIISKIDRIFEIDGKMCLNYASSTPFYIKDLNML